LYIGVADEADQIDILHVDDDESILDLSATFLEKNHDLLSIRKKLDTKEALDYLETTEIDCIVSDYDMPGLNGIEFLEQVREPHPESTGRWTRSKRSSR
jgi:CheY-like chemotaxis protein